MTFDSELELFVEQMRPELSAIFHDLHQRPELAFAEELTSALVAERLRSWGIETHVGLARTGVVGVVGNGDGPAIGLRADMDALPIAEPLDRKPRSLHEGVMHACGHDGHTTMLLGAARWFAELPPSTGRVYFVFQPAEENEGGGRALVEEGLFETFPMDVIFGLHNLPGIEAGSFVTRTGAMLAAFDTFELVVTSTGGHGSAPHDGRGDPIVAAAALVSALQSIVSRALDPHDPAVLSVCELHGGDTWNVIPSRVELRGSVRRFSEDVRVIVERRIREMAKGIAQAFDVDVDVVYSVRYPTTVNQPLATKIALEAASATVGRDRVDADFGPLMGSEDFSFLLQVCDGAFMGLGIGHDSGALHTPEYLFNEEVLSTGVSYWVRVARLAIERLHKETRAA